MFRSRLISSMNFVSARYFLFIAPMPIPCVVVSTVPVDAVRHGVDDAVELPVSRGASNSALAEIPQTLLQSFRPNGVMLSQP